VFKGRLTPVLTDYPLSQSMVYLVYVSRKYLPLKIRTFLDFMAEAISQSAATDPRPLAIAIAAGH
jgi:DNA-binding transcriptional LysR family regulator